MSENERLTARQFQESGGVDDWRVLLFGANAWFATPSHAAGAELVARIASMTTEGVHRLPDVDVRARGVHVRLPVRDALGVTTAAVALARSISAVARDLGLTADPSALQAMQLAIDTLDRRAVLPFWQAALGYQQFGEDDLVDPLRRDPRIWFQPQDQPRPLRNRIHLDIARTNGLTPDTVEAVGGRFRDGAYGVGFTDAEGNEADLLGPDEVAGGAETADWRVVFGGMTFYQVAWGAPAAELVAAAAALADSAGLPLLIDVRPDGVTIDTGKDQWEDPRFGELARSVQAAARRLGLTADLSRLRFVQLGIDAVDIPALREFWRVVLGYDNDPREFVTDIFDPRRLSPPIFFQQLADADSEGEQARRAQRNRIHVDLFVPDDQAQARIDAALAAGGRIVYDAEAPEWWTLADPEGNEIDIAVSVGREEIWQAAQAAGD
ncbi:VOC family protein [Flindersiella endophytica]